MSPTPKSFLNGAFYGRCMAAEGAVIEPDGTVHLPPLDEEDEERFERLMTAAPTADLTFAPEKFAVQLDEAYLRYLVLAGLVSPDEFPAQMVRDDREHFSHLKVTPRAEPLIEPNQVEFMHKVSGLPREWCAAFSYGDFVENVAAGIVYGDPEELIPQAYREALELTVNAQQLRMVESARTQAATAFRAMRGHKAVDAPQRTPKDTAKDYGL